MVKHMLLKNKYPMSDSIGQRTLNFSLEYFDALLKNKAGTDKKTFHGKIFWCFRKTNISSIHIYVNKPTACMTF